MTTYLAKSRIQKHIQKSDIDFIIATYKEVEKYYRHFQKGQKPSCTLQEYESYIKELKPENSYLIEYLSLYSNQAIYKGELDLEFDKDRYLDVALYLVDKPFKMESFDSYVATKILKHNSINKDNITERYFLTKDSINRITFFRRSITITAILLAILFIFIISVVLLKIHPYQLIGYAIAFIIIVVFYYSLIILSIKRLKDMEKSGWWSVLMLIPYVTHVFYFVLLFAKRGK